jgi:hypothetical protein
LVILFLTALATAHPLGLLAAGCRGPLPCCGCGGKMKCCAAQADQSPANTPATPAPESAQKDFQLLNQLPAFTLVTLLPAADSRVAPHTFAIPLAGVVPLFTRDCAFLI